MSPTNKYTTKLVKDMGVNDNVCVVVDTSNFPDNGNFRLNGEDFSYEVKTPISFEKLTRGLRGSIRKSHAAGSYIIYREIYNPAKDALNKVTTWIPHDLLIDENGELVLDNEGDLEIATGLDALDVALRIRVNSQINKGINGEFGIDISGKTSSDVHIEGLIRSVVESITSHEAVREVQNVSYEIQKDQLVISMNVFVQGLTQGFEFLYKINYKDNF